MNIGFEKNCKTNVWIRLFCAVLLLGIIIAVCISATGGNNCVGLCPAQSFAQSLSAEDLIQLEIPPNIGITKIYASLVQGDTAIDGGHIMILSSVLEYDHFFVKSPLDRIASFDTTFVQPLCIGEEGATLFFTPVPRVDVSTISITVVYCPDFCATD